MPNDDYVELEGVECGVDSPSGLAFNCLIDGEWVWVPYSQTKSRDINKQTHGSDRITVKRWLAEKNGWI